MNAKVLIVEDEEALALLLQYNLEAEGFRVSLAQRGDEAEVAISEDPPDLIILDWMLPGLSGIELCRRLRAGKTARPVPILILTARGEEQDRIRGLTVGADDYVVKPFSVPELLARIRAILRRASPTRIAQTLEVDGIQLDREAYRVMRNGRQVRLGPTEFKLLEFLMEKFLAASSRGRSFSTASGAGTFMSTSAPSTSTSAGCEKPSIAVKRKTPSARCAERATHLEKNFPAKAFSSKERSRSVYAPAPGPRRVIPCRCPKQPGACARADYRQWLHGARSRERQRSCAGHRSEILLPWDRRSANGTYFP